VVTDGIQEKDQSILCKKEGGEEMFHNLHFQTLVLLLDELICKCDFFSPYDYISVITFSNIKFA
jgi:hypothetical protein